MPFTLRIGMTGLCMFVPDAAHPDGPCLHALLLTHAHHPHLPRLVYDKAHERKNSVTKTNKLRCIPLDDYSLRFDGLGTPIPTNNPQAFCNPGGTCSDYRLPNEVIPMDDIGCTVKAVDRTLLGPNPPGLIAARITIHDGFLAGCAKGEPWQTKAGVKPSLTPAIVWEITTTAKKLTISLCDLRAIDEPEVTRTTLFPLDGALDLVIYNSLAKDLPPGSRKPDDQPKNGEKAEHFEPYFDAVEAPECKEDGVPRLNAVPGDPQPSSAISDCKPASSHKHPEVNNVRSAKPFNIHWSAHTSTCVTAQSPPK